MTIDCMERQHYSCPAPSDGRGHEESKQKTTWCSIAAVAAPVSISDARNKINHTVIIYRYYKSHCNVNVNNTFIERTGTGVSSALGCQYCALTEMFSTDV